jgi:acetyl esterase/lipase
MSTSTVDPAFWWIKYTPEVPVHLSWCRRLLRRYTTPNKPPLGVDRKEVVCRGNGIDIRFILTCPSKRNDRMPTMLWFHGGGMIAGDYRMDWKRMDEYAQKLGLCSISVDYRLAPENPAPAAIDDGVSVWKWILTNAGNENLDLKRLIIGGGSAGTGLAASVIQRIHDMGGPQPILQFLTYPMLDDRTAIRTETTKRYVWSLANNRYAWGVYLGVPAGNEMIPEYAVPSRREDLSGLPPAWLGVGTLDLFHDEDIEYARRLQESGVAVDLKVIKGMFHSSEILFPTEPRSVDFKLAQESALRKAIA